METNQEGEKIPLIVGEPTVSELAKSLDELGLEATAKQLNLEPERLKQILRRYGISMPADEELSQDYESRGVISDVWYGQRSLGETWWTWNVIVGNIGFNFAGMGILAMESPFMYYLFEALSVPYIVWIVVGAWRSATNNPGFWAGVVKFLLIVQIPLAIIGLIMSFTMDFNEIVNL